MKILAWRRKIFLTLKIIPYDPREKCFFIYQGNLLENKIENERKKVENLSLEHFFLHLKHVLTYIN